ncbi:transcriptional regulator [Pseudomonas kermanshahensis]|jgi:Predicted transcriptional regulator|uniref:Transcriptional regulator n=1 Tax=Pseudomonas kermanshahensis TaxID=2745482 RepID=A0ABU8RBI5_9PSED|nr:MULTISPECIES: transcriptional regulator [Pseudomonas]MBC3487357.1 transcriptional regulator [Pseudomonas sp. SWRI50]MBC3499093.1 transcriptional regulator [Pseudomonas sp. SWRI67]MBV4524511.1 transcriptional regulator [Pseudomonas kermanshahensis]SMF56757.1 putative transcriptional regulator [Pseudomonas sp. LAIL14HWK12:I11]SMR78568.1 putative transcriptional regulator [Pseudomonas sp. LAIL14HWK12:I10]
MPRNLFTELTEGLHALAEERQGKKTLRSHKVSFSQLPPLAPNELLELRQRLNMSRAVFANYLRTNARTLESWEQGRSKPNAQAVTLIRLVQRFPETVDHLASLT